MLKSLVLIFCISFYFSCKKEDTSDDSQKIMAAQCFELTDQQEDYFGRGALLASRIKSLNELMSIVSIQWYNNDDLSEGPDTANNKVIVRHCSAGRSVISTLEKGISQNDIMKAKSGSFSDKIELVFKDPEAIRRRKELKQVYVLSRRYSGIFSVEDVAFYYIAEAAVKKIKSFDQSIKEESDKGEKGYINTFNHITAQAIITAIYTEDFADYIADIHELKNMPELTTGVFTKTQLENPDNNPVDNYVDMINNEWGQEIGLKLKEKYNINENTIWTVDLLTSCLNELQAYYSWSFQIEMEPFRTDDGVVIRFTEKLNLVNSNDYKI